ncbi:D-2-hydroxyacid dehydrogenase [Paeniroseomonas aquatica]|uniref:D-2-hydroxyacid dehydrogenase n=1 Tax=Paeniroseomonas aquatica TaxID=373043 RepID=A0ABT8AC48_9PROT|nr:D-2-hydroxyacid dehydrogenase [Paeniroseomonas aquatica]MDN3567260.1 D-2-hydroxyacid dehydrogenase [Paeniroseomonas aquatica]
MKLLLSDVAAVRHGERIRAAVPAVQLVPVPPDGPLPETAGAEVAFVTRDLFVGGTRFNLTARFRRFLDLLAASPDLRWVQTFSAGTDMAPYQAMLARGLTLTNSAGASAGAVATTAVTGLLALARGLPRIAEAQRRRAWEPLYAGAEPRDIDGQSALILGTGPIGQEIARLCGAFGLRTTGIRRDAAATPPPGFAATAPFAALPALLPRTDWLILACPLTETTRGLIDARALALLPPGRHLVNVARGGIVVEDDLLAALRAGHLAGAFLDVFALEPLPAESPFWDLPNVIVSPHSAAASDGLPERVAAQFCGNLGRWARGEPLLNLAR